MASATAWKQRLKAGLYLGMGASAHLTGAGAAWRALAEREPVLRVLMYHKVNPQPDNPPNVPPSLFAAQMEHLAARFRPISVDDYLAARRGERALPRRAVLVTFDDGYRDNLEHAAPVLARLGIPAVIFLPTGFLSSTRPLPHDERRAAAGVANPTLTWDEARRLQDFGFEIGSHGESHRIFSSLPPDEARAEIVRSKAALEERLGRPVRCFAYVKGRPDTYSPSVIDAVRDAGYALAFATHSGPVRPGDPPYTLRRYNVEPFSIYTFGRFLEGDCDLVALKDSPLGLAGKRALNRALRIPER